MAIMKAQGTNPRAPSKAPSRPSKRPATPRSPTPRPRASGTTRPLSGPRAIPKMAGGGTVRGDTPRGTDRWYDSPSMPPPPRRKVSPKAATIQKTPSQLRAQGQKWLGGSPRFSVTTDGPYGKLTPMKKGGTVRRKR